MDKIKVLFFSLLIGSFLAPAAQAHQPGLAEGGSLTLVKNPEVSRAFYGELKGNPAEYLIEFNQPADLYMQILVPDLPGIKKDKSVKVYYASELGAEAKFFAAITPAGADWKNFYEEYAGDNYWAGPEFRQPVEAGYYLVKVSSPDNSGKYVLAVGEKEEFTLKEIIKTAATLPRLKTEFFNKPAWSVFEGRVGRYAGFGLLGLIILFFMFYKFNQVYK